MTSLATATKTVIQNIPKTSKLFQLLSLAPNHEKTETMAKCHQSMINNGIIKPVSNGMYAFLPLGLRILNKLTALVDREMEEIGAQKMLLPALVVSSLWKQSKRYDACKDEMFITHDRHKKEMILGPTYEEAICNLMSSGGRVPSTMLPLKLYQISSKWRDELRPRHGFLRSKEFVMKDLYTFDTTLDNAKNTYELVCNAYNNLFEQIGVKFVKAVGHTGSIGGVMSHEYHYLHNSGEDTVLSCMQCNYNKNILVDDKENCPKCGNKLSEHKAIEVGHAFLLDTLYSDRLHVVYNVENTVKPCVMGCFGIGLSRIISAVAEILSNNEELRWPEILAPYTACIIPPKKGSKEEPAAAYIDEIYKLLRDSNIDVILDDRTQFTIGKRFKFAQLTGYPYVIVIGRSAMKETPLFEVHNINTSNYCELRLDEMKGYFDTVRKNIEIK